MNEQQFLELSKRRQNCFIAEYVYGWKWYEWKPEIWEKDRFDPDAVKTRTLQDPIENKETIEAYFQEADMKLPPVYRILNYQSWEGIGKGISHANENGYSVNIWVHENESRAGIVNLENGDTWYSPCNENSIMINFFVVYCKALGVLE